MRALCLSMALFCGWPALAAEDASSQVQRDTSVLVRAMFAQQPDTVLAFTHPFIVRFLGGEQRARAILGGSMAAMLAAGFRLETLEFPRPADFVRGTDAHYAIVHTRTLLATPKGREEHLGYWFGVRDLNSSQWYYIDGSNFSQQNVRQVFADFPTSYTFPAIVRKNLP